MFTNPVNDFSTSFRARDGFLFSPMKKNHLPPGLFLTRYMFFFH
jgi:hypothetical protein